MPSQANPSCCSRIGTRTGTARTNPLAYFCDGDDYVVVASKGGAPTNPDWYHNLIVHPDATIEVGTEELAVTARVADGPERKYLWEIVTAANPASLNTKGRPPERSRCSS